MKEYKYTIDGNKYEVAINEVGETTAKVTVNGAEYTVELLLVWAPDWNAVNVNPKSITANVVLIVLIVKKF